MKKTTKARKAAAARKPATKPTPPPKPAPANTTNKTTKKDAVTALLQREGGATLDELMTSTGWQAHSVRGFISGTLRKKLRLTVATMKREDGLPAYRIAS
jgi:hypothetical protein